MNRDRERDRDYNSQYRPIILYPFALIHNGVSLALLRAAVEASGAFSNLLILSLLVQLGALAAEYSVKLCLADFSCVPHPLRSPCLAAGFVSVKVFHKDLFYFFQKRSPPFHPQFNVFLASTFPTEQRCSLFFYLSRANVQPNAEVNGTHFGIFKCYLTINCQTNIIFTNVG